VAAGVALNPRLGFGEAGLKLRTSKKPRHETTSWRIHFQLIVDRDFASAFGLSPSA